jgi:hypothetical protein
MYESCGAPMTRQSSSTVHCDEDEGDGVVLLAVQGSQGRTKLLREVDHSAHGSHVESGLQC